MPSDFTSILGVDPGASGGIALLTTNGSKPIVYTWSFNGMTLRDMWMVFGGCLTYGRFGPLVAYLEEVHAMPKQGVASTFKFGRHYGNIEAFLTANRYRFERVIPSTWQRPLGLIKKPGETLVQKKNRHKALAEELFPEVKKVTHANADALLIAEYGRRVEGTHGA